jgi:DNA-binding beta-propeller fold protein YncE
MLSLGLMPYGAEDSDEKGVYLLKMLINRMSEDSPKYSPLSGEMYTPTYIDLKIKEKIFNVEGLHAVQGFEFRDCCNDISFAQGYINSVGILNNDKQFQFEKIKNVKDNLIALSSDITTDMLGNVYVTSYRNGTVTKFDKNLKNPLILINNLNYPLGISTWGNNIITVNSAAHEIIKSNLNGNIEWRRQYTEEGLHNPYGVEVTSENIFVTFNKESVIVKMDLNGNIIKMIGPSLPDGTVMSNLQSISIGPKGNVYAIDTLNTRIVIFNNNLEYIAVAFDNNIDSMRGLEVHNVTGEIMVSGFSLESPSVTEGNSGIFLFSPIFNMLNEKQGVSYH